MKKNLIGPHIRDYRKLNRWTQKTLSAKLRAGGYRVTRCMIANWELQRSTITDPFVMALAKTFGISIDELFGTRGEEAFAGNERQLVARTNAFSTPPPGLSPCA